jgi:hypothetical protein
MDASYRTSLPGDLALTATVEHLGSRPATAADIGHLGGKQLMLPSLTTLDLGTRQLVSAGKSAISVRMLLRNVFDAKAWQVVAADALMPRHRRSVLIVASVDF